MGGTPIPHLHSYDEGSEATNDRVRAVPAPFTDNLFNQMSSGIQAWMDWYHKTALVVLFEQSGAAEPGRPFAVQAPFGKTLESGFEPFLSPPRGILSRSRWGKPI